MEMLFTAIIANPDKIVMIGLLFVALWLGKKNYENFKDRLDKHEEASSSWSADLKKEFDDTKLVVNRHSEDMGKATKAMSGESLKVQQALIDLRSDVSKESAILRDHYVQARSDLMLVTKKAEYVSSAFDEKVGKIIVVERNVSRIEESMQKIIKVVKANTSEIKDLKNSRG